LTLEAIDDPELVAWRDSAQRGDAAHASRQRLVGQTLQLPSVHDLSAVLEKSELLRDRSRGETLVAGDHHGPNAGLAESPDRLGHAGGRGIHQTHEADERQIAKCALRWRVGRPPSES
jgi:hypothetical protein